METQPNSAKNLRDGENEQLRQSANPKNVEPVSDQEAAGAHYHNYVPRHSSHGRSNIRGISSDHEPGTIR
ncbi:hypothetical protein ACFSJU_15460 [Paradesertivirga mongoliensis]|uniref:Uncharacterized protein n=1 Tax=Paradesertivirga mongoliensis TaxID=2100740 RepID=A0ABW4ZNX0_9SPHI|nr:hypothetical protein [Pedobacter mongoliensis]